MQKRTFLLLVLAILILLLALVPEVSAQAAPQKWEYCVFISTYADSEFNNTSTCLDERDMSNNLADDLNLHGEEGWQLVSAMSPISSIAAESLMLVYTFMRPGE